MAKGFFLRFLWSPLPTSLFTSHLPTNVNSNFLLCWCPQLFSHLFPCHLLCPFGICPPLPAAPSSLQFSDPFLGRPHPRIPFPTTGPSAPLMALLLRESVTCKAPTSPQLSLAFLFHPPPGVTFAQGHFPPPSALFHQGELSCQ